MENTKHNCKHLTHADRREIEAMLKNNLSIRRIALRLNKSPACICKEIKRNSRATSSRFGAPRNYEADVANHKAYTRRYYAGFKGKKIIKDKKLHDFIDKSLLAFQSPEAISGRLSTGIEGLPYVSRSTIEDYLNSVYGEHIRVDIKKFKGKYKRKRMHSKKPALDGRIFIDERPEAIINRERVGDVEMDFIVSGKHGEGHLLTVIDRKTRRSFIRKLYPVNFEQLTKLLLDIKKDFPELKSITTDNDILLRDHNTLTKVLGVPIFFCHPYSSWEKGSIENLNKFVRRFIRKGTDLRTYTEEQVKELEDLANNRFMMVLDYLTPNECYEKETKKRPKGQKNHPCGC